MLEGKSHDIPKRLVREAWLKVKKNGGAGGSTALSAGVRETEKSHAR
jgi:nitrogen fixation protein